MNLPTPDNSVADAAATLRQAFQSNHIQFMNAHYRLGDTVALMTIRAWVEREYGSKTWYLQQPNPILSVLEPYAGSFEFRDAKDAPPDVGTIDDTDIGFWYWSDFLQSIDFRVTFRRDLRTNGADGRSLVRPYRIVFAPLVEADYRSERALHPRFYLELIQRLADRYPGEVAVIQPPFLSSHDEEYFRIIHDMEGVRVMSGTIAGVTALIAGTELFIGCDTGLSHVAACFPDVQQIALYSKELDDHDRQRDDTFHREKRDVMETVFGYRARYNATPNKAVEARRVILFEHGGCDEQTLARTLSFAKEVL